MTDSTECSACSESLPHPDNPGLDDADLGVYIIYNNTQLPYLAVWMHCQKRSYVIGIEPGTCRAEGRIEEKKRAVVLKSDQTLYVEIEIGVIEGR